jgi:hypothetical protein
MPRKQYRKDSGSFLLPGIIGAGIGLLGGYLISKAL